MGFIKHFIVPEYELVPMYHWIQNEIPSQLKLYAFGQHHDLSLKPTEGLLIGKKTPVWAAYSDQQQPFGLRYNLVHNVSVSYVYITLKKKIQIIQKIIIIFSGNRKCSDFPGRS